MKRRLLLLTILLSVPAAVAAQNADPRAVNREAVRAAVLDYVEAIYQRQPERVEQSVRPDLAKVGYHKPRDGDDFSETPMTYEQLLETAQTYNRSGRDLSNAPRLITVLDVLDRIAAAKLVAPWGIDYFHLVKDDGKWRVLHVVWQSHTPETAQAAREEMARLAGEGDEGSQGR